MSGLEGNAVLNWKIRLNQGLKRKLTSLVYQFHSSPRPSLITKVEIDYIYIRESSYCSYPRFREQHAPPWID